MLLPNRSSLSKRPVRRRVPFGCWFPGDVSFLLILKIHSVAKSLEEEVKMPGQLLNNEISIQKALKLQSGWYLCKPVEDRTLLIIVWCLTSWVGESRPEHSHLRIHCKPPLSPPMYSYVSQSMLVPCGCKFPGDVSILGMLDRLSELVRASSHRATGSRPPVVADCPACWAGDCRVVLL